MLVVEDGTGKDTANTFTDVANAKAYANLRGYDLPDSDAEIETLLVRAADYLRTRDWVGEPLNPTQSLPFPRAGQGIPPIIVIAQVALAVEAHTTDLQPNVSREVQKEKVGSLEVSYFQGGQTANYVTFAKVEPLIAPFLNRKGIALTSVRL